MRPHSCCECERFWTWNRRLYLWATNLRVCAECAIEHHYLDYLPTLLDPR